MSLFAVLRSSADAMRVYQRGLTVAQNNVANVSTPGYAKQIQGYEALRFDPAAGIIGGVAAGEVQSTRDAYADETVRRQLSALGKWAQGADTLAPVETAFDVTGESGVPGALSKIYEAFSNWSVAPNDAAARQAVISSAQKVCDAFAETGDSLARTAAAADTELKGMVESVNALTERLRDYNIQRSNGSGFDAGLDSSVCRTLEELAELVDVTVLRQSNGSVNVMLAGSTPLVVGEFQYDISVSISVPATPAPTYPGAPPSAQILDYSNQDITAQLTQGRVGGLLEARNNILGAIRGSATEQGELNVLAKAFADKVNSILTSGLIDNTPTAGVALFSYGANPADIAKTLTVSAAANQLAAIDPGPPAVSNGIPIRLASLESASDASIGDLTYTQYYGSITSAVGQAVSLAQDNQSLQEELTAQARELREQISGVSLDEEAIHVLELQRSYQALAKMVGVLNELTETVVNLI